jgi:hypothetical protein
MTNYVFGDDLKFFVKHHLPSLPNPDKIAEHLTNNNALITVDEAVSAWCEHDALHYLSQQPFNKEGEEYVAYLEKTFNRGWLPFGERYNTSTPKECECSHITQELITETAEDIQSLMYDEFERCKERMKEYKEKHFMKTYKD